MFKFIDWITSQYVLFVVVLFDEELFEICILLCIEILQAVKCVGVFHF